MTLWSRVISLVGLGQLDRHPWTAVEEGADDVGSWSAWSGHVQLRTGTLPPRAGDLEQERPST